MSKNKKKSKGKIIIGIVYALILVAYLFFVFGNLIPTKNNEDYNILGNSIYVLKTGDAVVVDFDKEPTIGDNIVCLVNNQKVKGTVNSISDQNKVLLTVNDDGNLKYYTEQKTKGVITKSIPAFAQIYRFCNSIWGIVVVIILPCLSLIIYEIMHIIRLTNRKKDVKEERNSMKENMDLNKIGKNESVKYDKISYLTDSEDEEDEEKEISSKNQENDSFDTSFEELKFKMDFQDTTDMSTRVNEVIENDNEEINTLKKYGISTVSVDDGVDIAIDPEKAKFIKLKLKNTGSLLIETDNYEANIEFDFDTIL